MGNYNCRWWVKVIVAGHTGKIRELQLECIANFSRNGIDNTCHTYSINIGTNAERVNNTPFSPKDCSKDDIFRYWQMLKMKIGVWSNHDDFAAYVLRDQFKITDGYEQTLIKLNKQRQVQIKKSKEVMKAQEKKREILISKEKEKKEQNRKSKKKLESLYE
jgi:hypothetical protein